MADRFGLESATDSAAVLEAMWADAIRPVQLAGVLGWGYRLWLAVASVVVAAGVTYGVWTAVFVTVAAELLLQAWRFGHNPSFDRCVVEPARRADRSAWYRREWRWLTFGVGLAGGPPGMEWTSSRQIRRVPRLRSVHCESWIDRLEFRPLAGQTIEQWQAACEPLAEAMGVERCVVVADYDGMFLLGVIHDDSKRPIAAPAEADAGSER